MARCHNNTTTTTTVCIRISPFIAFPRIRPTFSHSSRPIFFVFLDTNNGFVFYFSLSWQRDRWDKKSTAPVKQRFHWVDFYAGPTSALFWSLRVIPELLDLLGRAMQGGYVPVRVPPSSSSSCFLLLDSLVVVRLAVVSRTTSKKGSRSRYPQRSWLCTYILLFCPWSLAVWIRSSPPVYWSPPLDCFLLFDRSLIHTCHVVLTKT